MAKEMIISCNGFERKIAIMEDGVLSEYYVERMDDTSEVMVGNIYKGRVTKVLPGMQSAFVAIGLERDAFLYVADIFEGEDVEYEAGKRESKRPTPSPQVAQRRTREAPLEKAPSEELEAKIPQGAQPDRRKEAAETSPPLQASQRDYDEQVAELIEGLVEDLHEVVPGETEGEEVEEVDLKDAIIDEKLTEAVQQEEMDEDYSKEASSAADIRVGTLRISFPSDSSLERVIDDPVAMAAPEEAGAAEGAGPDGESSEDHPRAVEGSKEESSQHPREATVETEAGKASAGTDSRSIEPSQDEPDPLIAEAPVSRPPGDAATEMEPGSSGVPESSAPAKPEVDDESPLSDADASVRHHPSRAKFAVRRKPRRRRPERNRSSSGNGGVAYGGGTTPSPTITELLKENQELLVQIAKEPIGKKGARVTSHIALPGRYLVYMPTCEHIGVSRRIPSHTERTRLRRLASKGRARLKADGGFIVRTAAVDCGEADLLGDMKYLMRIWNDIRQRAEKAKAPALVYREVDVVERILRDRLSRDFTAIRLDSEDEYTKTVKFVDHFQPELVSRVKLYTRPTPIFEQYGIQPEIEKSMRPRVWLKSGGYIVINQTEALVAIDVNTGKFVGKTNRFEDTITRTNMEAAKEIARQLRLRDLGGIIVLDFIDMEERKNRQRVMQVVEEELRNDRAPAKVLSFNDFGLVAITRKRVRQSLERTLCEPCSYCHGSGMVKSLQTVCYEIFDEVRQLGGDFRNAKEVVLRVHPAVADALREKYPNVLEEVESYLEGKVTLETDPLLHQEQFDIALV